MDARVNGGTNDWAHKHAHRYRLTYNIHTSTHIRECLFAPRTVIIKHIHVLTYVAQYNAYHIAFTYSLNQNQNIYTYILNIGPVKVIRKSLTPVLMVPATIDSIIS